MPTFVYDFLPRVDKSKEVVVIQNYGGMTGGADYFMYSYCVRSGLNIRAVYAIKMPENFTLTFTVPKFYLNGTLKKADKRIADVLNKIAAEQYELPKKRRTKEQAYFKNKANWHIIGRRFRVSDSCARCGKCVDLCPADNISLENGGITFGDNCVACLGCYHRCPKKAITYLGKKKKDRYFNPNVNEFDMGKDL